jgi:hypothetical protein
VKKRAKKYPFCKPFLGAGEDNFFGAQKGVKRLVFWAVFSTKVDRRISTIKQGILNTGFGVSGHKNSPLFAGIKPD